MRSNLLNRLKKIEESSLSGEDEISAIFYRLVSPGIETSPEAGGTLSMGTTVLMSTV
jgi:hypothetical protein